MIEPWGYVAVLAGTFFEGEAVLLVAACAAHQGRLNIGAVAACAWVGTLCGDQVWFLLGRRVGRVWLTRHPRQARGAARVERALARWRDAFILGYRALYGVRTAAPFALGAGGVGWRRFTLLNLAGAGLWVGVVAGLGYGAGGAMQALVARAGPQRHVMITAAVALGLAGVSAALIARRRLAQGGTRG